MDEGPDGPAWTDKRTAEALEVAEGTVERKSPDREYDHKLDGEQEAELIRLTCSEAPEGRSGWSLRLLADRLVELGVVESISHEAVRQTLKKNELKPHLKRQWVIPPEQSARFMAKMEDVLSVYKRSCDPDRPVVCMDETPRQLIEEVREPIPAAPGREAKQDHHYQRNGVVNLFTFFEPLASWRTVMTRRHRTGTDWAQCIDRLLTAYYPEAERVVLVMDNLNTHKLKSLYEAFEPSRARELARRLEIHYTPEHGSWLNMAEIEQSVLANQCLLPRIPSIAEMRR